MSLTRNPGRVAGLWYLLLVFLFSQPALFGEIAIMLWLVTKGANPPPAMTGIMSQ